MKLLNETLSKIEGLNLEVKEKARQRIDMLVKPQRSLGKLEEIAEQLCGITGELFPEIKGKSVIVMCGDHGVCEEGVAAAPQQVTTIQTLNFTKGVTGVCALAKLANANIRIVDIGIAADIDSEIITNRKIKYGTNNISKGPAMTREEAIKSLEVGIEVAIEEIQKGNNLIATGEMGIGNTTPSSAIVAVIGNASPEDVTGIGANLPEDKLANKIDTIKRSIGINNPDPTDGIDILAKVGGLEIGGMAGVMLGGAAHRVPIVIDGFISTAAALIACSIEPKVRDYLIPSHSSREKAAGFASELLKFEPMLDMNMRLGEGTGAVLAFNIIEAATYMNKEMITFAESGIEVV